MGNKKSSTISGILNKIGHGLYITMGLVFLLFVISLIVFIVLYIVKSLLGIDIFPNQHMWEVLF